MRTTSSHENSFNNHGAILSRPVDLLVLTLVNALLVSSSAITEIVHSAILVDGCCEVKIRWSSVMCGMSLMIEVKYVLIRLAKSAIMSSQNCWLAKP